jgi:fructan beta-fructosidase
LLVDIHGQALEIIAEFQINNAVDSFGLRVHVGSKEHTTICCSVKDQTLTLDRAKSGEIDFHEIFPRTHSAHLVPIGTEVKLHIFVDTSSIEVFANDGLLTFTECIFPNEQSHGLELFAEGGNVTLKSLDIYQLNPATFQTGETRT